MPPDDAALVERDGDLATLVAALARPPAVAVVEGEPGIGKTHLVRAALDDRALAGRQRLVGHAGPTLASCPLAPVIEAVASVDPPPTRHLSLLTGALRVVLPELAGVLPPPPPPLDDPDLARHRLVRALAELLAGIGPAILVLEDLQWADEGTTELIRRLDARPPPELSIVVTGDFPAALPGTGRAAAHIHLSPLPVEAVGRLAAETLGEPGVNVPREPAALLHERSGGVPFVVREDVRLLRDRGLLRPVDGEWALGPGDEPSGRPDETGRPEGTGQPEGTGWPDGTGPLDVVPPAVGAQVIARARDLGAAGIAVLEATAVLGESAEPELVAGVAGMGPERAHAALGEAARHRLLDDQGNDGGTVRFRHELARLAVYEAIPGYRRCRLHATAARELMRTERGVHAVRAVEHYRRAGDVQAWARGAEAAAELAAADGSFEAAHACLRDLLRSDAVAGGRRVEVAIKLGWAATGGVDRTGTTAALLAATRERCVPPTGPPPSTVLPVSPELPASPELSASPAQRAELLLLQVWSLLESAVPRREIRSAVAELRSALGDLAGRPDLQAIALAVLAMPTRGPGRDVPAQMVYLSRARATLVRTSDPLAHTVVATGTAHLLLAVGSPVGRPAADALPARGDRPEVNRRLIGGLLELAEAALHLGQYARSLELVERGRRLAAEVRSRMYDSRVWALTQRVRWAMGELGPDGQAEVLSEEPYGRGSLHQRLLAARIDTGQGRLDHARRALRAVAEEACEVGEPAIAAHAVAEFNRVALTKAHRRLGHALARRILDELARRQLWVWMAPLLPYVPLDLVNTVLPRYRRALAGRDVPLARAALSFAEARMNERHGDAAGASAGYRSARHGFAALPDPRLEAHACTGEVRTQISAGSEPDAELLRRAWSTYTALGAVWDANRLKQLMRSAGLPVPHRRGRPGYGNRLSPREREVAELAAMGHTNRDIAGNLYLSERTVKFHLTNAMRKLGVSSRRRLRDALEPAHPGDGPAADLPAADGPAEAPRDHTCRCARCGRRLNPSISDGLTSPPSTDYEIDSRSADRYRPPR